MECPNRIPVRRFRCRSQARCYNGFTLLEVMISVSLLVAILLLTSYLIDNVSRVVRRSNANIEAFKTSREAFDRMTSRLSQALLNTYWDYYDATGNPFRQTADPATFSPSSYGRYSDLHFVCGKAAALLPVLPPDATKVGTHSVFFCAPLGLTATASYQELPSLLIASGYFVAFGSDKSTRPDILSSTASYRYRWRLLELGEPTESLRIFNTTSGTTWFTQPVKDGKIRTVADNVIALVIWPRLPVQDDPDGNDLTTDYSYDTRTTAPWTGSPLTQPIQAHQLPPTLQVMMVVIDEPSAIRLQNGAAPPAAIDALLAGLFQGNVSEYDQNVETLRTRLNASGLNYRIFTSTINMKGAKWSR